MLRHQVAELLVTVGLLPPGRLVMHCWVAFAVARLKVRSVVNIPCSSCLHVLMHPHLPLVANERMHGAVQFPVVGAVSKMEEDLRLEELRAKVRVHPT